MSTLLIITLVLVGLGAVTIWVGFRLVRRAVAHGRRRALQFRTRFLPPGPRRDAAVLRQQLSAEVHVTRQLLSGASGRIFQADPSAVLAEAAGIAGQLDNELALIETFPDRTQQRAALARITPQVVQLIDAMYSARNTMLRTAAMDRERDLTSLSEAVAHEAESLRNYEQFKRDLTI